MKKKQSLADIFLPVKIKEVEEIILYDLDAIKVTKEDKRFKYHLNDPFCPDKNLIQGVYVIYSNQLFSLMLIFQEL